MKIFFVQLPVPTLVPQQNVGNHLLASSSLILHLLNSQSCIGIDISVLPQEICSRAGDYHIIDIICKNNPDVVAFTCTVWNIERTQYIARLLKSRLKNVKIWLGGPEIAYDSYFLADNNPPFDLAVEGEGEEIFALLIRGVDPCIIERVYVPSVTVEKSVKPTSIKSLSTIHEPFINGFARMEQDRVLVSELFRGCKYRCRFCRYHSGTFNKGFSIRPYEQVKSLFCWARQNGTKEIFLLDPSFEQRADINSFLDLLSKTNKDPVIPIFAELRAEAVDQKFAEKLRNAGVCHVETGLQTVTPQALKNAGRIFDREKFISGIHNLQSAGIKIRPDIMIGLPGDTPEGLKQTALFLNDLNISQHAQVFKTQVLPGTKLRQNAGRFLITYENRPPYQITSTPHWSQQDLNESIFEAESLLNINCSPEERPLLLLCKEPETTFRKNSYISTDITYAYYFDCTTESGREYLFSEDFSKAAFTVSLTCKVDNYQFFELIKKCICHFYEANPFSSSAVAFHVPAQFPLDIFDEILETGKICCYSNYLQSLYPTTYSRTPHRRLMACLDLLKPQNYSKSWLEDLRELTEVVWYPKQLDEFFDYSDKYNLIDKADYIYLDTKALSQTNYGLDLDNILQSEYAEQIIFSDIDTQWKYFDLQSKNSD